MRTLHIAKAEKPRAHEVLRVRAVPRPTRLKSYFDRALHNKNTTVASKPYHPVRIVPVAVSFKGKQWFLSMDSMIPVSGSPQSMGTTAAADRTAIDENPVSTSTTAAVHTLTSADPDILFLHRIRTRRSRSKRYDPHVFIIQKSAGKVKKKPDPPCALESRQRRPGAPLAMAAAARPAIARGRPRPVRASGCIFLLSDRRAFAAAA